jgi:hypothetical protein
MHEIVDVEFALIDELIAQVGRDHLRSNPGSRSLRTGDNDRGSGEWSSWSGQEFVEQLPLLLLSASDWDEATPLLSRGRTGTLVLFLSGCSMLISPVLINLRAGPTLKNRMGVEPIQTTHLPFRLPPTVDANAGIPLRVAWRTSRSACCLIIVHLQVAGTLVMQRWHQRIVIGRVEAQAIVQVTITCRPFRRETWPRHAEDHPQNLFTPFVLRWPHWIEFRRVNFWFARCPLLDNRYQRTLSEIVIITRFFLLGCDNKAIGVCFEIGGLPKSKPLATRSDLNEFRLTTIWEGNRWQLR